MLTDTTVDDDVHQVLVLLVDLLGIGEITAELVVFVHQGRGHDRGPQLLHQVRDDRLVRDADADGFLLALEDARNVVVGFQDEGEGTGQVAFHHLEHVVVDGLGEVAQHTEVVAHELEIGFLLADAFDLADALKGALVADAATETVKRVGREDDGAAIGQTFQDHLDVTRVRVRWVEFEYHGLEKNFGKNNKMLSNIGEKLYFCSPSTGYLPQMFLFLRP